MRLPDKPQKSRLELAPLMDIIFIVLIFLVYAMLSMSVQKGVKVNLPTSNSAETIQSRSIALTIEENGSILIDNTPVAPQHLLTRLQTLQSSEISSAETLVRISADANLPYQKLYNILDQLRLAGYARISLQARDGSHH